MLPETKGRGVSPLGRSVESQKTRVLREKLGAVLQNDKYFGTLSFITQDDGSLKVTGFRASEFGRMKKLISDFATAVFFVEQDSTLFVIPL